MTAVGIDLGGTKIETQLFDEAWNVVERSRVPTPKTYEGLVTALADQIAWADARMAGIVPVGIGAAGLINPETGLALTANLPASNKPLPSDISKAVGRHITYVNDCRALALSEAIFGAGRSYETVMSLILGTGIGGGVARSGVLMAGPTLTGGEFGHTSAPAHLVVQYGLPVVQCGCGRMGCIETIIAGPGLRMIAKQVTGLELDAPQIAQRRTTDMAKVWGIWCDFTADLLRSLILTVDPDVIILGGGLSQIEGVTDDLALAAKRAQIGDFGVPPIVLAQGGDSSGARGAAYAAWQESQ